MKLTDFNSWGVDVQIINSTTKLVFINEQKLNQIHICATLDGFKGRFVDFVKILKLGNSVVFQTLIP